MFYIIDYKKDAKLVRFPESKSYDVEHSIARADKVRDASTERRWQLQLELLHSEAQYQLVHQDGTRHLRQQVRHLWRDEEDIFQRSGFFLLAEEDALREQDHVPWK